MMLEGSMGGWGYAYKCGGGWVSSAKVLIINYYHTGKPSAGWRKRGDVVWCGVGFQGQRLEVVG